MQDRVIQGDCIEALRSLPENSVDAIVTDPPAGIAFMGKGWDTDKGGRDQWVAWLAEVMREALRVLKPGGHALVWALPRTSHWTATALEDAGFEIRDRCSHIFGSGFPKSLDVSKALDKAAGAQREVVGKREVTRDISGGSWADLHGKPNGATLIDITAPATDAARQWDGWGTALKPAVEDWWLCRKPLAASSVAGNVLAHGVGALNIAASRVAGVDSTMRSNRAVNSYMSGQIGAEQERGKTYTTGSEAGRWPANLLLSHAADCVEGGPCSLWCPVRELDAQSGVSRGHKNTRSDGRVQTSAYAGDGPAFSLGRRDDLNSYGDTGGASRYFQVFRPDNNLPVVQYDCNSQASTGGHEWASTGQSHSTPADSDTRPPRATTATTSGTANAGAPSWPTSLSGNATTAPSPTASKSTTRTTTSKTTASRTLNSLTPSPISASTADVSCEMAPGGSPATSAESSSLSPQSIGTSVEKAGLNTDAADPAISARWSQINSIAATFKYQAKASRSERTHNGQVDNRHCTVKPQALMAWLIGLITPPGGIVLDCFAGSGSTLVAAKSGGYHFIGIEREAEYVAICEARLAAVEQPKPSLGSAVAIEPPKPVKPKRTRKPTTKPASPLWEASA